MQQDNLSERGLRLPQERRPGDTATRVWDAHVPVVVWQLIKACHARALPVEGLFRDLGFELLDLDRPDFLLSTEEALTLVRRGLALLGGPASLGLQLGRDINQCKMGLLALGHLASPTLGHAMELTLRHPWSAGFLLVIYAVEAGEGQVLGVDPLPGGHDVAPFLVDNMFAAAVALRRRYAGDGYAPQRVDLVRSRPPEADLYEAFFGCPVQFGAAANRLVTAPRWLDTPLPTAHRTTWLLASRLLDRMADEQARLPVLGLTVDRALRKGLPRPPSAGELAASLHMSERSLRRKLSELGLSYDGLLDAVRRERAQELLRSPKLSLSQIAAEVGFADVRSFRRAFKRWTGQSPTDVREGD